MTPAHYAAEKSHTACLEVLLKSGANLEATSRVRLLTYIYGYSNPHESHLYFHVYCKQYSMLEFIFTMILILNFILVVTVYVYIINFLLIQSNLSIYFTVAYIIISIDSFNGWNADV